jgi:hypothetical protein
MDQLATPGKTSPVSDVCRQFVIFTIVLVKPPLVRGARCPGLSPAPSPTLLQVSPPYLTVTWTVNVSEGSTPVSQGR